MKEFSEHTIYYNKKYKKAETMLKVLNLPHNREYQKKRVSEAKIKYFENPEKCVPGLSRFPILSETIQNLFS